MNKFQQKIAFLVLLALNQMLIANSECLPSSQCAFIDCCCQRSVFGEIDILCESDGTAVKFPERNTESTYSTKLHSLTLYRYKLTQLPSKAFSGLTIKNLVLSQNGIETIQSDLFSGLEGLNQLDLYEPSLNSVDSDSFKPVENTLTDLELWNKAASSVLLSVKSFPKLINLRLWDITSLNAVWFDNMPELTGLILSDNAGITRYPESGFFTKNPKLNKVELENNKITDLLEVLTWLQNVKSQLLSLILRGNLIQKVPSEINAFTKLIGLNLRANKISQITAATFNGLTELITLDVRDNGMSAPINTFKSNTKLSYAFFDGNNFNKIHDFYGSGISQNSFISYLSYVNQSGYLIDLKNYQFDYLSTDKSRQLNVLLEKNPLVIFGNKTFCSRSNSENLVPITHLSMDYLPFARIDMCLLRQFGLRNRKVKSSIAIEKAPNSGYTQLCSCEYYMFMSQYSVQFSVADCDLNMSANLNSCKDVISPQQLEKMDAECAAKLEFDCNNVSRLTSTFTLFILTCFSIIYSFLY